MNTNTGWQRCETNKFWSTIAPNDHVVQVYDDEVTLFNTLAGYAADSFIAGDCLA